MFVLKPYNAYDMHAMMALLEHYQVKTRRDTYGGKDLIIIDGEDRIGDEGLAEFAFQINFFQQAHYLCEVCKKKVEETGEGPDSCGHLTFTRCIKGAL